MLTFLHIRLLVSLPESERQAMLDLALSNPRVKALWFSFGEHSSLVPLIRAKRPDILIFHQLHSASEAVRSLERGTADVIVAQGTESGGHGRLDGTGTGGLVLLPEIVRAVRSFESKHGKPHIPVLATGGLTVPSQVAATLLLGADACVLGTRLMVCKESPLRAEWKAKIVQAKESQETARTLLYDRMKWGAMEQGWEKLGYDGRVLANEVTRSYNSTPEIQKELVAQLEREGGSGKLGAERDPLWAGMGVGMITASDSVAQAIDEIVKGAEDVLLGASKLVVGKL